MRINLFFRNYCLFEVLILLTSLLQPTTVSAHAIVTETTLRGQALSAGKPTLVSLNFNSQVELSLSKIYLVSKGDTHDEIAAKPGRSAGQIIITIPSLEPGNYAIHYKVFAADGHLTEDVLYFSVSEFAGK